MVFTIECYSKRKLVFSAAITVHPDCESTIWDLADWLLCSFRSAIVKVYDADNELVHTCDYREYVRI